MNNLKKMNENEIIMNVNICRPFLSISKKEIYKCSKVLKIPFLKNTTPKWSQRGRFREQLYPSLQNIYGESVDDKLINTSELYSQQFELIKKYIYQPILDTFKNDCIIVDKDIGFQGWSFILEYLCYNIYKINKPSNKSILVFIEKKSNGKFIFSKNFKTYKNGALYNFITL